MPYLYALPLWVVTLAMIAVFLVAAEIGFRIGLATRARRGGEDEKFADAMMATLFALLGLLLAFTYSYALQRMEARKDAMVVEANALGTAFLRADLAPEAARDELRRALLDYARTRVAPRDAPVVTVAQLEAAISRSEKIQGRLWPALMAALREAPNGPQQALLVSAVNEVLDAHTRRVFALRDRLPGPTLGLMVGMACAALGFSAYGSGRRGRISRLRGLAYAAAVSVTITTILDFDQPTHGLIRVDARVLHAVVADMEARLGG